MRIGEISQRSAVAPRMLRYYEAQGLLQPGRHPNGYRDYSESDLNQVVTIRDLSRSGVPTRFIKADDRGRLVRAHDATHRPGYR